MGLRNYYITGDVTFLLNENQKCKIAFIIIIVGYYMGILKLKLDQDKIAQFLSPKLFLTNSNSIIYAWLNLVEFAFMYLLPGYIQGGGISDILFLQLYIL